MAIIVVRANLLISSDDPGRAMGVMRAGIMEGDVLPEVPTFHASRTNGRWENDDEVYQQFTTMTECLDRLRPRR